jgi:hypothetical protein
MLVLFFNAGSTVLHPTALPNKDPKEFPGSIGIHLWLQGVAAPVLL